MLSVMLGDGWYKGRFSYLDEARVTEIYGDKFLAAAQLLITYKDGSQQKITTDENWKCLPSPVLFSNIYDGEVYDANRVPGLLRQNLRPREGRGRARQQGIRAEGEADRAHERSGDHP